MVWLTALFQGTREVMAPGAIAQGGPWLAKERCGLRQLVTVVSGESQQEPAAGRSVVQLAEEAELTLAKRPGGWVVAGSSNQTAGQTTLPSESSFRRWCE